jgi:hypothetical protein
LPQTPMPAYTPPPYRSQIWDDYFTESIACSAGVSHSTISNQPTGSCGGALGFTWMWFEVGAFAPQTIQPRPTGYFTADFVFPLGRWCLYRQCGKPRRILPLGTVGITHLFGTTNALDFSAGADIALNSSQSLRIELKDYANFGHAPQHNAMMRITLVRWLPDP